MECNLQAHQKDMSTVGRLGHESRFERLCDMPPATRCATIGATYRCIDFSSEGGKTMCSCASCLPTGCVTKDTVVFVGQSSGVLDDIRLRCRLSCNRVCCSSCRFFVALAIGAATGDAKCIVACPDVERKIGRRCPMASVIRGYVPLCVAM